MSYTRRYHVLTSLVIIIVFLFHASHAYSQVADVPLFLTTSVDPNIMFIIDDSGSMHWETMPDPDVTYKLSSSIPNLLMWLYPRITGLHGGTDYNNTRIPRFTGNLAAFIRSAHNNTVYYDPAVTYRPWVNADGSEMPDAPKSAAPNRPRFDGTITGNTNFGTRNLEQAFSYDLWRNDNNTDGHDWVHNIWPAIYYHYNGMGSVDLETNYTRVEIRPENAPFDGHGRENRTDCAVVDSCTYAEEIQNFANWYTYHRNRIFASRAGIGRAFADFDGGMRVGFGAINHRRTATTNITFDGLNGINRTILSGVRDFTGVQKDAFYTMLYDRGFSGDGTALRRGLDGAGQYFSRSDIQGPWSTTPGVPTPGETSSDHLTCRPSYTILMTDGFATGGTGSSNTWNAATAGARANVDGSTGSVTNVHPDNTALNYTYAPSDPYQDTFSETLADIAMYYWSRDLRPDLANRVPTSNRNEAFWQHMVTYGVGLGVQGTIAPVDAWQAVKDGTSIAWPNPAFGTVNCGDVAGACEARIDDLLHASINSRGGFFSAAEPEVFAAELAAVLEDIVARTESSASSIATNTTRLGTETLIYQAKFDSSDWSGQIIAYKVNPDGSPGDVAWDTDDAGIIPAHGARKIYTWNGTTGVAFTEGEWGNLSAAQRTALEDEKGEAHGKKLLHWLRGSDADELKKGGPFRTRNKLLGDIVNSDPAYVGVANFGYDRLPEGVAGQDTYQAFRTSSMSRRKMLYVGANDGMLHALDAETGVEQFAYMPKAVFSNISLPPRSRLAILADPDYTHKYFVDGSPFVGDAYDSSTNTWKTILVGTTGAGGRSIFALDVTDPDSFNESKVLWEKTNADTGFANLGYTFSRPVLARMQNGAWAVVFGNGFGVDQNAVLFIINAFTGALIRKIDTEAGGNNGLATPALLPDGNRTISYAYAGDLQGNLWKFDLTHSNIGQWGSPYKQGQTPLPLFIAKDGAGKVQPITAPLEIIRQGGHPLILFGTGKYYEVGDHAVGGTIHSFYGILDNGSRITVVDRSDPAFPLQKQEIIHEAVEEFDTPDNDKITWPIRVVTDNPVDYSTKRGWYLDLVSPVHGPQGERVVSAPLARSGRIIFTTLIPSDDPCEAGGTSWLMELGSQTGGRLDYSVFDLNVDDLFNTEDFVTITIDDEEMTVPVSGLQSSIGIIKTPAVISSGEVEYKFFGGSSGEIDHVKEKGDDTAGRQSWRQLQ